MTAEFTPGPWRLRDEEGEPYTDVMVGDRLLASAYPEYSKFSKGSADQILRAYGEAKANARLIAAAPDLYEAVRLLLSSRSHHPDADVVERRVIEGLNKGLAALAKARGTS